MFGALYLVFKELRCIMCEFKPSVYGPLALWIARLRSVVAQPGEVLLDELYPCGGCLSKCNGGVVLVVLQVDETQ